MRTGSEFSEAGNSREGASALGSRFAVNEQRVIDLIRSNGPISRTDISRVTGISAATSGRIAGRFIADGVLIEPRKHATGIGRPSVLLDINPRRASVLAIDLSATHASIALADMAGEVTWQHSIEVPNEAERYSAILAAVKIAGLQALATDAPIAIGTVGIPAVFDPESGQTQDGLELGWSEFELLSKLRSDTPIPFAADNSVNLSAIGHRWRGAAVGIDNFAVIHLGDGVGGAVMSGGNLVRGRHNTAGELGHMPACKFTDSGLSKSGSMNETLSMAGLRERARSALAATEESSVLRDHAEFSALDVVSAATDNDEVATAVVRDAVDRLAYTIVAIGCIAGPEAVVIDGELGRALGPFLEPLQTTITKYLPSELAVLSGQATKDGALHGAISSGLEVAWHHEFPPRSSN